MLLIRNTRMSRKEETRRVDFVFTGWEARIRILGLKALSEWNIDCLHSKRGYPKALVLDGQLAHKNYIK